MSRLDEALARLERAVARLEAVCAGAAADEKVALRVPRLDQANAQRGAVFGESGADGEGSRIRGGRMPQERGNE